MKKFLVSIVVGVTFMAMGATMLFFEIKDYETTDACDLIYDQSKTEKTFDVSNEHLYITLDGRNQRTQWVSDESMGNEVKVEVYGSNDVQVSNNRVYIDDDYLDSHYTKPFEVFDKLLEGLKNKQLYYCNGEVNIVITCSKEVQSKIKVNYD